MRTEITAGLQRLGLPFDDQRLNGWLAYLEELRRWSGAYNLVAPGDMDALVSRHLLDSLSIHDALAPGPLLDVGTGAGFPGLPLAIAEPDREVWLLDSAGKKVRFLRHVIRTLALDRVHAVHGRVENFSPGVEFSTIVSRAFSSLQDFVHAVRHLATPATRLLAMKGKRPVKELAALPNWVRLDSCRPLTVPGLDSERYLVVMTIPGTTPEANPGGARGSDPVNGEEDGPPPSP